MDDVIVRYAILTLAVVALVLGGVAWFWHSRAQAAQAALSAATARVEAYAEANRIHREHVKKMEAALEHYEAVQRELSEADGHDALLSDFLSGAARRVWP